MSNKKITDLVELTTPATADLLEIVDDVAGETTSKKITIANLLKSPGPIGGTAANTGAFSTLSASGLITATGGQIKFPATQAPSADVNTLDDYEEGTWTPLYAPETGSFTTMTMDVVYAVYVKIGKMVHINAYIRTDNVNVTGASNDLTITGLPFAAATLAPCSVGLAASWASNAPIHGYISTSTIILKKRATVDANDADVGVSDLTTGETADQNVLVFSATYTV